MVNVCMSKNTKTNTAAATLGTMKNGVLERKKLWRRLNSKLKPGKAEKQSIKLSSFSYMA